MDDTSEGHALKTGQPMISPDIETETRVNGGEKFPRIAGQKFPTSF
jgi:hypothetical protein